MIDLKKATPGGQLPTTSSPVDVADGDFPQEPKQDLIQETKFAVTETVSTPIDEATEFEKEAPVSGSTKTESEPESKATSPKPSETTSTKDEDASKSKESSRPESAAAGSVTEEDKKSPSPKEISRPASIAEALDADKISLSKIETVSSPVDEAAKEVTEDRSLKPLPLKNCYTKISY